MCGCHWAPLSATIYTFQATHSQHHTLFNSYQMVRSPLLRSHLLPYRRSMVLLLQASCPAHCYQAVQSAHDFTAGSTRNVTGDVMPLAEAITQLSFLEFLQRCGVSIAPPQPSQLPVPISLLDAAVQTTPPCDVFQDVSTPTSDQLLSSISFAVAVQTSSHGIHTSFLDAAVQTIPHSTPFQHVSTQMGSRSPSSFSVDVFVQTPIRSAVLHDTSTQLPLTEFFIGCIFSSDPLDRQNYVRQSPPSVQDPHALPQPPPGLEQLAPPSGLAIGSHSYTTHGASVTAAPLRARLRSAISVTPPQLSACTIHVGTHHARSATTGKRSASNRYGGIAQSCYYRFSCRVCSFSKTACSRSSFGPIWSI